MTSIAQDPLRVSLCMTTLWPGTIRASVSGHFERAAGVSVFRPVHELVDTIGAGRDLAHGVASIWADREGFEGYRLSVELDGTQAAASNSG